MSETRSSPTGAQGYPLRSPKRSAMTQTAFQQLVRTRTSAGNLLQRTWASGECEVAIDQAVKLVAGRHDSLSWQCAATAVITSCEATVDNAIPEPVSQISRPHLCDCGAKTRPCSAHHVAACLTPFRWLFSTSANLDLEYQALITEGNRPPTHFTLPEACLCKRLIVVQMKA